MMLQGYQRHFWPGQDPEWRPPGAGARGNIKETFIAQLVQTASCPAMLHAHQEIKGEDLAFVGVS